MMLNIILNCFCWATQNLNIVPYLTAENLALRQQLIVLKRTQNRPKLKERDRLDIDAEFDYLDGCDPVEVSCVDPMTGDDPEDPMVGFLPPYNEESHHTVLIFSGVTRGARRNPEKGTLKTTRNAVWDCRFQ